MIGQIQNNLLNFKGGNNSLDNDFIEIDRMFKTRDAKNKALKKAQQTKQAQTYTYNKRKALQADIYENKRAQKPKKKKINIPLLIATALASAGIYATVTTNNADKDTISLTVEAQNNNLTSYTEVLKGVGREAVILANEAAHSEEVLQAVEAIKNDPELKEVYYNMGVTLQRLGNAIDNPSEALEQVVSEPWAQDVDIELLLPQIFYESSGQHYNEDGSINTSSANCSGLMQISEGAQTETNKKYFSDDPQDRTDPVENIKLGAGLTELLLDNYFEGDLYDALCAYNVGQGNILKGNYLGSEKYAEKILNCREILKAHPEYTQMLLDGDFDEYLDEFIY